MKEVVEILTDRKEYCLLVKSAFDSDFCDHIIEENKQSFKEAKIHYPTSYRNNERHVFDNNNLSKQLFQLIKNHIPNEIEIEGISLEESGKWKLDCLNSRIRICRYLPNQYFNKHLDGVHFVSELKQSKLTFMVYLNGSEEFEGGRTLFFNSKNEGEIIGSYCPQKGDLIIFDHNLWHSGETVLKGEKYILRSDIIYSKIGETKSTENDFCGEGHLGYIWTVTAFNKQLVTSGRDKKIKIWSKEGKKNLEVIGHENSVLSLIALDRETIISASRDCSIKIWRWSDEDGMELKNHLNYHEGTVLTLCKINEKEFFSGGADGVLNRINREGQLITKIQAHEEWIWGVTKINNHYYATISEDGTIKIWDLKHNEEIESWNGKLPINSIVVQESIIYVGRLDGTIVQFRLEDYKLSVLQTVKGHEGIIRKLLIYDDCLYSASEDNTLKIWNKDSLEFVTLIQHKNFVQDVTIFEESIITVSYDGEIKKSEIPITDPPLREDNDHMKKLNNSQ